MCLLDILQHILIVDYCEYINGTMCDVQNGKNNTADGKERGLYEMFVVPRHFHSHWSYCIDHLCLGETKEVISLRV